MNKILRLNCLLTSFYVESRFWINERIVEQSCSRDRSCRVKEAFCLFWLRWAKKKKLLNITADGHHHRHHRHHYHHHRCLLINDCLHVLQLSSTFAKD